MQNRNNLIENMSKEEKKKIQASLDEKLAQIMTAGEVTDLTPEEEALFLTIFESYQDDSMSEKDAMESSDDLICVNGEYYAP